MQEFYDLDRNTFFQWLNREWDINFHSICDDVNIQGSPERTVSRAVFEDIHGHRFFIEKFDCKKYQLRLNVACVVDYLNENGLKQALSYKKSNGGSFLSFYKDSYYQISDFLDSTGIKQPDYLSSAAMGESFALFLTRLSKASVGIENLLTFQSFSIKVYIYQLFSQMKIYDNMVYKQFLPVLDFLENNFMNVHDQLPVSFCHGDP